MHDHKLLFLDFDETLFDHYAMLSWIDDRFSGKGLFKAGSLLSSADDYHNQISDILRLYKHKEHYLEITGTPWSYISGQIQSEMRKENVDFCYQDTHDFISYCMELKDYETRILSFGNGDYQRFKMNTCPVLRREFIPIHITEEPKRLFLQSQIPADTPGVLIDDKYPLNLPANIKHILIDRKNRYGTVNDVEVINSLIESQKLLSKSI